jgi:hypothetical protein
MAIAKDEATPIEQLRNYCLQGEGKQDWQNRLIYVTGDNMLRNFSEPKKSAEALAVLLDGLPQEEANELIVGLIHHEWEKAKSSDPGTFMRSSSLSKTAMMDGFNNAIKNDPALAHKFIDNPMEFVRKLQLPDHLKEEFNIILNDAKKSAKGDSVYILAHKIIFGGLTGPLTNHFNVILLKAKDQLFDAEKNLERLRGGKHVPRKELAAAESLVKKLTAELAVPQENYRKVISASEGFVSVNSVVTSSGRLQKEEGNTKKSPEEQEADMQTAVSNLLNKGVNPDTASSYVIALDKFMSHTCKDYKSGEVTMGVLDDMKYYSAKFNSQGPSAVVVADAGIQAKVAVADPGIPVKVKDFVNAIVSKLTEVVAKLRDLPLPSWAKPKQSSGVDLSVKQAEGVDKQAESKHENSPSPGRR